MNIALTLGITALTSIVAAKLIRKLKLPSVTGYLLAGLIIGPSILKIIPESNIYELEYISEIALGFIAFHIGESFEIKHIKKLAKNVISITLFQAVITVILVFIGVYFVTNDIIFSILVAAISAATAPAATLMVIKEYRSKGSLTDTLVSVVALDDIICIILFSIAVAVSNILLSGSINFITAVIHPLVEIFGSIILGGLLGIIIVYTVNRKTRKDMILVIPITLIVIGIGISQRFELSILLTCASIGAVVANVCKLRNRVFDTIDYFAIPIYILFFTFSGMHLDLGILKDLGVIGIVYIVVRSVGKIFGAYLGGVVTKAEPKIKNYLGLGLLPQAGVAIGLAVIASDTFPELGVRITNLIMAAVFFYEIIGPVLTKKILIKCKEATEN